MSKGKFITSKQAAEKLGFTPDYIRKMCVEGRIKAEKLGSVWVTTLSAIRKIKRQRHSKESGNGIGSEE
jgi:excisionase family DNA binding protein